MYLAVFVVTEEPYYSHLLTSLAQGKLNILVCVISVEISIKMEGDRITLDDLATRPIDPSRTFLARLCRIASPS